ncbi:MAG: hypothetical protein HYW86_02315 [Candidatus Roizmanbacteria bacterium]|nr:MAG: hypothetical protein HYW86_02315 [Candidatus Roizmanbacteria bacterium]
MNQRELLIISIGVFLTIIAWMIIDIFQIRNQNTISQKIKTVEAVQFKIDDKVFKILNEKKP